MNQFQNQADSITTHVSQIIGQLNLLLVQANNTLNQLNFANYASVVDLDKIVDAKIMVNDLTSKVLDMSRNLPRANVNLFNNGFGTYPQQQQMYPGQTNFGQWQPGRNFPCNQTPTSAAESVDQQLHEKSFGWGKKDDTPKRPNVPPVVEVPKVDGEDEVNPILPGGVDATRKDVNKDIVSPMFAHLMLANTISPITNLTKDSITYGNKTFTSDEVGIANWIDFLRTCIVHNNTPNKSFIKWVEKGATINAWEIKIPSEDGKTIIHYFALSPLNVTNGTKIRNYRLSPKRFTELNKSLGLDYTTIDLTN